ncbi:MAG: HD domain-containing protein [Fibrobacterales bacterium]
MKKVALHALEVDAPLDGYLCHVESGEVMHKPGDTLSLTNLLFMEDCDVSELMVCGNAAELKKFQLASSFKKISIQDLPVNEISPVDVISSANEVVAQAGHVFTVDLIESLKKLENNDLFYKKDDMERNIFQAHKYSSLLESDKAESVSKLKEVIHPKEKLRRALEVEKEKERQERLTFDETEIPRERFINERSKEMAVNYLRKKINKGEIQGIPTDEKELFKSLQLIVENRSEGVLNEYIKRYKSWIEKLDVIFYDLRINTLVEYDAIEEVARDMLTLFLHDTYFFINLTNRREPPDSKNYLVVHSVNVAIHSINIATASGYSREYILELAVGALLHDVGHLFTYKPMFTIKVLDDTEQHKFDQHSLVGVAMQKNITKVPVSTGYIILQHHERLDESGPVSFVDADKVHDFARLVAVAVYYETECRFCSPHDAMMHAIHQMKLNILESHFLRLLLMTMSIFPIGTYVLLDNGVVAKVIGCNKNEIKKPFVSTIATVDGVHLFPLEKTEILNLADENVTVKILKSTEHPSLESKYNLGF